MAKELLGSLALLLSVISAQADEKSALERDPKGWIDLLPGKDLKGWTRVPIAPDTKLAEKNPWSVKGKRLICDGVGIKEMLLYDKEFTDGTYHVEWRFKKLKDGKNYNSGVYVRTARDGGIWHQAQVAHVEMPPKLGDLFGDTLVKGEKKRVVLESDAHKRANPPGEWNTYEITAKGATVSVWVNGATTSTWKYCPVEKGHVGLQAELYYLEFRNLKFKPTP